MLISTLEYTSQATTTTAIEVEVEAELAQPHRAHETLPEDKLEAVDKVEPKALGGLQEAVEIRTRISQRTTLNHVRLDYRA